MFRYRVTLCGIVPISIHAPHAGCDPTRALSTQTRRNFNPRTPCGVRRQRRCGMPAHASFQSTHPMRGATCKSFSAACRCTISIHAPHAGCDISKLDGLAGLLRFQSTHPMRGATHATLLQISNCTISIHAPHAGCDFTKSAIAGCARNFNPRTPCGVRHDRHGNWMLCVGKFQSTHPMRGATDPLDVSLFPR